jgi:hypothetical protein
MRWKSITWAVGLLPVLAGCGTVRPLTADTNLAPLSSRHAPRTDARGAWQAVCAQYPDRAFTAEFHDGFLDGYGDCLGRSGSGQPSAGPFIKFVREKRATLAGRRLNCDYSLGFQYGADVAVACGSRAIPIVSVTSDPTPLSAPRPVPGTPKPKGSDAPVPPKPAPPVIKPFTTDLPDGKFAPLPALPDPTQLPVPNPPLPVPEPQIPLPIPPVPVPTAPSLMIFEDLPVTPYRPIEAPPLPVGGPFPQK